MSATRTDGVATLRIRRGGPGEPPRYEEFAVPFERGASVLDGLVWVRTNVDPGLALRFSCINANVCKECTMLIDGAPGYACTARLEPRTIVLEPLPGKDHIRDLVTDTLPPRERLVGT
jgi:succinate dehydrogenase / fumarate reductase iron-sulfur subunit